MMRRNSSHRFLLAVRVALLLALAAATPAALAQTKGRAKQGGAPKAAAPKAAAAGDIMIRVRSSVGEQSFESVEYVKGARQRTEMSAAGGYKMIMQCDLGRYVQVNDQSRTYLVQPFAGREAGDDEETRARATAGQVEAASLERQRGGVVTIVNAYTDTGERKQMFGYTARRLKGVMEFQSSPDACRKGGQRTETDGWYIDLKYGVDCPAASAGATNDAHRRVGCRDEIRTKSTGVANPGFPVLLTSKSFNDDGSHTTMTREVIELSRSPLDAALFEVPAGYTEAKDYAQMSGSAARAVAEGGDDVDANGSNARTRENRQGGADASNGASASEPSSSSAAATVQPALGPKKPGVVRIGVVMPRAQMGQGASLTDASTPVRDVLVRRLSGTAVEIAVLEARGPQQAELEAREKECDYVLYTGVTQKKGGGGGFGGFLKKAIPVVGPTPVTGADDGGGGGVSGAIKAKDEITVEFRLLPAGGGSTPKASNTLKAKAKYDGEDVLTPLIQQVATAVLSGVAKG